MIVVGVLAGRRFPASATAALHRVTGQDSSLASAVQNVMQSAGGARERTVPAQATD